MEKDRDREAEELNISREEIDKELTEEEAMQLREERRLRREQIRTAPMDSSILDEPDEPTSPYRTRSSSRVVETSQTSAETPAEAPVDAVEAMDQAPLEQKKQPSLPIVNKVVITHVKAKTGPNPSGVPVLYQIHRPLGLAFVISFVGWENCFCSIFRRTLMCPSLSQSPDLLVFPATYTPPTLIVGPHLNLNHGGVSLTKLTCS